MYGRNSIQWLLLTIFYQKSPQLAAYDRQLERLHDRIEKGHSYRYALDVVLLDSNSQARVLLFIRYLTAWILRLVSPNKDYPHKSLRYILLYSFVCIILTYFKVYHYLMHLLMNSVCYQNILWRTLGCALASLGGRYRHLLPRAHAVI